MNIFDKNELNSKEALKQAKKLIGSEVIKSFNKSIQFTDEPRFYQYAAEMGKYSKYSDAVYQRDMGSGLSINKKTAQLRTLAETIERFSLSIFRKSDFKVSTFENLGKKAINPDIFLGNSIKNIKKHNFYWTKAFSIWNKKYVYIPAQLVYVPFGLDKIMLRHPISTGATLGTSYAGAIYRGICEAIERDAFMITYLTKLNAPKIDIKSIKNRKIIKLIKYFKRYFLELYLFDITTDVKIPTILTVIVDKSNIGPAISSGCSTNLDIEKAIINSIEECEKARTWIRYIMVSDNKRFKKLKNNPKEIKNIEDRGLFWGHRNMINKLNFLLKSRKTKKIKKNKIPKGSISELKKTLRIIKKSRVSLLVKDITPKNPSIKKFKAVKVIIPELQPLYLYEYLKNINSKRLDKFISKKALNKIPHPFV